jgi:acyl-CoA thioesterase FadM
MYPFVRLIKQLASARRAPPLGMFDTHVSGVLCWPWDLDMFLEMNNGRVLTLFDLGRLGLGQRTGVFAGLRRQGWTLTVAGSSTRYRRRVRLFDRLEMRTRFVGWDARFLYMEQSMWHRDVCTSHVLIRTAITDSEGLVRADRFGPAFGLPAIAPKLPDWAEAWARADAARPWPPMQEEQDIAGQRQAA